MSIALMPSVLPVRPESFRPLIRRAAVLALCLLPVACGGPQTVQIPDPQNAYIMPGVPRRAPIKVVPKEAELKSRPPAAISALLGEPTYIRREQPAEVWQFVTGRCVLDVTFYPDKAAPESRLSSWIESRDMGGRRMAVPDCLESFAGPSV